MAVMRVERNHNYTVMANYHLRDSRLSLKAKGLLSVMLSLPVDWDYTLAGLAYISKEGISAIRAAIMELEETGYVVRARVRNGAGQLTETAYTIYEFPQNENPVDSDDGSCTPVPSGLIGSLPPQGTPACISPMLEEPTLENPTLEKPTLENCTQQNKDREKKDIENTDTSYPYLSDIHHTLWKPCRLSQLMQMELLLPIPHRYFRLSESFPSDVFLSDKSEEEIVP